MVLEFGLLKTGLFQESEMIGEGINGDAQQKVVTYVNNGKLQYFTYYLDVGLITGSTSGMFLVHGNNSWTIVNATSTRYTSNSGVTWADSTGDAATFRGVAIASKGLKTTAIVIDNQTNAAFYSTNSGASWTAASSVPLNWTGAWCASFPTATVAVAGLDRGTATRGIMYSTNAGVDWTIAASGPVVDVVAIDMFSSTVGYAVDVSANIWKTTDGGVNWTDTTHNVTAAGTNAMTDTLFAVSATKCLYALHTTRIELYDNTAGSVTVKYPLSALPTTNGHMCSNFVRTTNGNIYLAQHLFLAPLGIIRLYRSVDDGVTWDLTKLPSIMSSAVVVGNSGCNTLLSENINNQLLFYTGAGKILLIDVSGGV